MNILTTIILFIGLPVQPGVSSQLATHRAKIVSDIRYSLSFDIPSNRKDAVKGSS
jgi:hypothetical protein